MHTQTKDEAHRRRKDVAEDGAQGAIYGRLDGEVATTGVHATFNTVASSFLTGVRRVAADGSSGWVGGNSSEEPMSVLGNAPGGIFPIARIDDQKVSCDDASGGFADLVGYLLDELVTWQPAAPDALAYFSDTAPSAARGAGANDNNTAQTFSVIEPSRPGSTGPMVFAWVELFDAIAQDTGIDLSDLHAASVPTGDYGMVMLTRFTRGPRQRRNGHRTSRRRHECRAARHPRRRQACARRTGIRQ